jgi:hypothetical protein
VVPTILKVDVNTKSQAIVDAVNLHFQQKIQLQQAQHVRKKLLQLSTEQLIADYSLVPTYIQALRKVDTKILFILIETNVF